MTSTDELRKLLDERGVNYDEYSRINSHAFAIDYCDACGDYLSEIEIFGACIYATKKYLTPEQAIAATLGNGTCEVVGSYYYDDYDQYEFEFSCGHSVNMYDKEPPNYCQNCGAKVLINQ